MADHHVTAHKTPTKRHGSDRVRAIARLLARQAAREAFHAALADSQATAPAPTTPATPSDED